MTFGKYTSKSFKWLVENDVGYCKYIVDRHMKEMRHPEKRKTINETQGWHKSWEAEDSGLPKQDIKWLKEDEERGLFLKPRPFSDMYGRKRWRKVLKSEKMWFHPPEMPGVVDGSTVPVADSFFRHRVFFWRPVGVWRYSVRCTKPDCPAKDNPKAFLYRCGYGNTVRPICDINGWYFMLTEVLACDACRHLTLYYSLIFPHLNYCNIVWASTHPTYINKLLIIQKRFLRMISHANRYEPSAPLFINYSLLSINKINIFKTCLFMFKFKNYIQNLPSSFHNFFCVNSNIHSYATTKYFNLPFCRTWKHQSFITYRGPHLWNSLNKSLKSSPSLPIFKKHLKNFLIISSL
ncbi:uncharacterized protein LOC133442243 [Cololabis saira]|uniref:uncharacterized protein LOC133442243 n=1 Tax=Cololabis saira TaxID=129043 RepID=UPI002AD457B7|nr:uncharacterized protein LOC133442243 [Cololabis saira]